MRLFNVLQAVREVERRDNLVVTIRGGAVMVVDASAADPGGGTPPGGPISQPWFPIVNGGGTVSTS